MATPVENVQIQPRQETSGAQTPTGDDIIKKKLTDILGDILTKAQEVGFELATLNCPIANTCPLVMKSKELIVALKKLFSIRKELEGKV